MHATLFITVIRGPSINTKASCSPLSLKLGPDYDRVITHCGFRRGNRWHRTRSPFRFHIVGDAPPLILIDFYIIGSTWTSTGVQVAHLYPVTFELAFTAL